MSELAVRCLSEAKTDQIAPEVAELCLDGNVLLPESTLEGRKSLTKSYTAENRLTDSAFLLMRKRVDAKVIAAQKQALEADEGARVRTLNLPE